MVVKLKRIFVAAVVFSVALCLFVFSEGVRVGVKNGIELCLQTVIPSLFLFTALTVFMVKSGLTSTLGKILEPFSRAAFNLSGEQFSVFLASLISGYPVGSRLVSELYKNGKVSVSEAVRMLGFCVCAGPGFIVLAVGESTLASRSDGYRLLIAHTVSAVLMALFSGIFNKTRPQKPATPTTIPYSRPIAEAFTESVCDAARSMFSVSAFVVAFGGLGGIFSSLEAVAPSVTRIARAVLEVTVGIGFFNRKHLPFIAFLLGFGGVSVHFQVLSNSSRLHYPYYRLLTSRIIHGALSAGLVALMEIISPRVIDTALLNPLVTPKVHGSPAAAIALLIMGAVLIFYCSDLRFKKV